MKSVQLFSVGWFSNRILNKLSTSLSHPIVVLGFVYSIATFIRFGLFRCFNEPLVMNDELTYSLMARGIAFFRDAHYFSGFAASVDLKNVLYPAFLSFLLKTHFNFYLASKLLNTFAINTVIFPAYLIARKFSVEKVSIVFSILVICLPILNIANFIMAEALFYPIFLVCIYLSLEAISQEKIQWPIALGLASSLLVAVKPHGVCFIAGVIVSWLLSVSFFDLKLSRLFRLAVYVSTSVISTCVLNYLLLGKFSLVAGIGGGGNYGKFANGALNVTMGSFSTAITVLSIHLSMISFLFLFPVFNIISATWKAVIKRDILFFSAGCLAIFPLIFMVGMTIKYNLMFLAWDVMYVRYYDAAFPLIILLSYSACTLKYQSVRKSVLWSAIVFGVFNGIYFFKFFIPVIANGGHGSVFYGNNLLFIWTRYAGTIFVLLGIVLSIFPMIALGFSSRLAIKFYIVFTFYIFVLGNWSFFHEVGNIFRGAQPWIENLRRCVREQVPANAKSVVLASFDIGRAAVVMFSWDRSYSAGVGFESNIKLTRASLPKDAEFFVSLDKIKPDFPAVVLSSTVECTVYKID